MKKQETINRTILPLLAVCAVALLCAGCATTEKLAENLEEKNVGASGFVAVNKIGLDTDKTPTLKSIIVSGDFQTMKADSNFVSFKREENSAWFNADSKTRRTTLILSATGEVDMVALLANAALMVQAAEKAE